MISPTVKDDHDIPIVGAIFWIGSPFRSNMVAGPEMAPSASSIPSSESMSLTKPSGTEGRSNSIDISLAKSVWPRTKMSAPSVVLYEMS